jgi:hypothetical protein
MSCATLPRSHEKVALRHTHVKKPFAVSSLVSNLLASQMGDFFLQQAVVAAKAEQED